MENTIQSDLIRGHINTIILKALYDGDRYGYDIVREIEQKSSGQYKLKQPTLYSCLKRLEIQGFIRAYWGAKSSGGRRKYYTLTDMGRELFIKNQSEWEYSRTVIDKLISDRSVNLDALPPVRDEEDELTTHHADEAPDDIDEEEISEEDEAAKKEDGIVADAGEENDDAAESVADESEADEATTATEDEIVADADEENDDATESVANESVTETTSSEAAATAYAATEPTMFSDTTAIMDELFRRESENPQDPGYADQLLTQQYTASGETQTITADSYFKDFYDEEETEDTDEAPRVQEQPAPEQPATTYGADDDSPHIEETASEPIRNASPASPSDTFLDYHTARLVSTNDSPIEHEYRNILGEFLQDSFVSRPVAPPTSPEPTLSEPAISNDTYDTATAADTTAEPPIETYTNDAAVNRKLNTLADEVRELGDSVVIRTHNGEAAKEYTNENYYYSNKLMLVHYAILFGIMMFEILFTAVFVNLVLHAGRKSDVWFYVCAVIVALVFPTVAFIRNYSQPNKRKRINFNLKNSLIYRCIAMAQCLLILYCLNVIAGMPLGFGIEYITSLLLPGLLCACFPISSLIFHALFKSKRFAVEQ